MVHTDVAGMNFLSLGGGKVLVAFIDEGSGYVKAFLKESKENAAEVL